MTSLLLLDNFYPAIIIPTSSRKRKKAIRSLVMVREPVASATGVEASIFLSLCQTES